MGYPPVRSGWEEGVPPWPFQDGVPPWSGQDGVLPSLPPARTKQQSEHLLGSGRYASCVHVGGLSCNFLTLELMMVLVDGEPTAVGASFSPCAAV